MTNHQKFIDITGDEDSIEVEAVKMLLTRISEDVECGIFEANFDKYPMLYKNYIKWLNAKAK